MMLRADCCACTTIFGLARTLTLGEVSCGRPPPRGRTTRYEVLPRLGFTVKVNERDRESREDVSVRHARRSYRCSCTTSPPAARAIVPVTRTAWPTTTLELESLTATAVGRGAAATGSGRSAWYSVSIRQPASNPTIMRRHALEMVLSSSVPR